MSVKPDLPGSLLIVGVAVILGLGISLPSMCRGQEKVQAKRASDSL